MSLPTWFHRPEKLGFIYGIVTCEEWIEVVFVSVDGIKSVLTRSGIGREFDACLSPHGKTYVLFHSECGKTIDYTSEFSDFFDVLAPRVTFPNEWIDERDFSVDNIKSKILSPLQLLQESGVNGSDLEQLLAIASPGIPCGFCSSRKRTSRCGVFAVTTFLKTLLTAVCKSHPQCEFVLQFGKLFNEESPLTCKECLEPINAFIPPP